MTTHEFLFGALAEIVDNARDAKAKKIDIFTVPNADLRGEFMLCFQDDGSGMDPVEAADIITFGKSLKRSQDSTQIGMYGNGLKSGSMRIGNDMIVFTKQGTSMTAVFLSRTFHEEEDIQEVKLIAYELGRPLSIIVPMPSFHRNKTPNAVSDADIERHNMEMEIIMKYSPFKTEDEIFHQFNRIKEDGTLVIIYNLKLLDSGQPELTPTSDDILLTNVERETNENGEYQEVMPERKSFRAYAAILYVDPYARIFIQGQKVTTKRLACCLHKPRTYTYTSARFKTRSEKEAKRILEEANALYDKRREAESKVAALQCKLTGTGTKELRAKLRKLQLQAETLKKEYEFKKQWADKKKASLREPKELQFIFGLNINNRTQSGMFIYNCSRLIKMYETIDSNPELRGGVVGIVDVPYLVLEPTHNKQEFADGKEYRFLLKAMGEHFLQYWRDVEIANIGVSQFWEEFGYAYNRPWKEPPSNEKKYLKKRAMHIRVTVQCDACLKWRTLPFSSSQVGQEVPQSWTCKENTDPKHNRCSHEEEKLSFPKGVLVKEKSNTQRLDELDELVSRKKSAEETRNSAATVPSERRRPSEIASSWERPATLNQRSTRSTLAADYNSGRRGSRESGREADDRKALERDRRVTEEKRRNHSLRASSYASKSINSTTPSAQRKVIQSSKDRKRIASSEEEHSAGAKKGKATQHSSVTIVRESSRPTRAPATTTSRRSTNYIQSSDDEEKEAQQEEELDESVTITSEVPTQESSDVGKTVQCRVDGIWQDGEVLAVDESGKWKVKWFHPTSSDLRHRDAAASTSSKEKETVESAVSASMQEIQTETPTSSTNHDEISNGYRTCLRYFLPPQWKMSKDEVSQLSHESLVSFPLDDFFDHYERGLRKLVSSFQMEASSKQQKLSKVRRMIAKLLKSINEEFDIDPEADNETVDELLEACLKQASMGQ